MVLVFLAVLVITAVSLVDILSRDPALVRLAPRAVWAIAVILLPLAGSGLWFLIGRRPEPRSGPRTLVVREQPAAPSAAPTGAPAPHAPGRPLSTEEQLAALEREIEEDRAARRIAELESELRRRRAAGDGEPA